LRYLRALPDRLRGYLTTERLLDEILRRVEEYDNLKASVVWLKADINSLLESEGYSKNYDVPELSDLETPDGC
jgi:hypothetical protein